MLTERYLRLFSQFCASVFLDASLQIYITTMMVTISFQFSIQKQREDDESGSEDYDPDEAEETAEATNEPVEEQNTNMNSEEEEEAEERAAQRELKNGLRNISFADDVEVTEFDGCESIFKGISFANASRGLFVSHSLLLSSDW